MISKTIKVSYRVSLTPSERLLALYNLIGNVLSDSGIGVCCHKYLTIATSQKVVIFPHESRKERRRHTNSGDEAFDESETQSRKSDNSGDEAGIIRRSYIDSSDDESTTSSRRYLAFFRRRYVDSSDDESATSIRKSSDFSGDELDDETK